jgi:hypothetical protein
MVAFHAPQYGLRGLGRTRECYGTTPDSWPAGVASRRSIAAHASEKAQRWIITVLGAIAAAFGGSANRANLPRHSTDQGSHSVSHRRGCARKATIRVPTSTRSFLGANRCRGGFLEMRPKEVEDRHPLGSVRDTPRRTIGASRRLGHSQTVLLHRARARTQTDPDRHAQHSAEFRQRESASIGFGESASTERNRPRAWLARHIGSTRSETATFGARSNVHVQKSSRRWLPRRHQSTHRIASPRWHSRGRRRTALDARVSRRRGSRFV